MDMTPDELIAARETLKAEVALLQKKVGNGQTLRVGERRFLLQMLQPADDEYARIQGGRCALDELAPKLCGRCRGTHVPAYRATLAQFARNLGFER